MRIISQDGYISLPYDLTGIKIDKACVYALFNGQEFLMAKYNSWDKACDAVDMCEDCERGYIDTNDFMFPSNESELLRRRAKG